MAKVILSLLLVTIFVCICTADVGDECFIEDPLNHGTYAPHPTDCNQFLQCTHGQFYAKHCPKGLHWCADETVCQWPDQANCEANITNDPTGTTEDSTSQPTSSTVDCAPTCSTPSFPPDTNDDVLSTYSSRYTV